MPSISGPRSTVASNSVVTPLVSGAARSSLIVVSSLLVGGNVQESHVAAVEGYASVGGISTSPLRSRLPQWARVPTSALIVDSMITRYISCR
jgi:hypothetical protein